MVVFVIVEVLGMFNDEEKIVYVEYVIEVGDED